MLSMMDESKITITMEQMPHQITWKLDTFGLKQRTSPKQILHSSPVKADTCNVMLHKTITNTGSAYQYIKWKDTLKWYDSMLQYKKTIYVIQGFSKFIKKINRGDLYEELMTKKLFSTDQQLMAVHHIMTGPERYTDDQLSPILEPLNKFNLQDQSIHNAVRVMFRNNTPEEAYDIIHSVYGRFPDIRSSLLLSYSKVSLKDTVIEYMPMYHRPGEQIMKNVLSLVKVVIVGIGKTNGNILSKLCDSLHNYTKSQSYEIPNNFSVISIINNRETITYFDSFMWILLVIYHELFKLQLSLTGADAMLHDIREMIMAFKYEDWENIESASAYIETCIDLQVTTPDQCLAIIKEMYNCNPMLLGYTMMALAKYLCKKQSEVTFQSMELRVLVFFLDNFKNSSVPLASDVPKDIILCITSLLQSDMKDNDITSTMSTIQELTDLLEKMMVNPGRLGNFHYDMECFILNDQIASRRKQPTYNKQNHDVIRLMIYHIVAIKKPEWLRKVSMYLNGKADDMDYRLLRLYIEYCVPEQEPIGQMEWIHNHYSKHLPVIDAMLKVTVCGELLSQGKTETIRKIVSVTVHSKSLCYRRFLQYKDKTFLKLALTVFLIKQQSSSDHTDDCTDDKYHKHDIFHWKWEANPTMLQTIKHDNLKMYDHTQLPIENLYLFLVKLQEELSSQKVRLDDIIQLIIYTLKRRTIARLVLFSNMAELELVSTTLTESFASFLHIDGDKDQHDIIYKCFLSLRHYNKIDHVDDEAINMYQEHFPFIAAMEKEEKMEKLACLITIVVLLILLLISSALSLTSSQLKKYLALKYAYEDSVLYLLWCSGDVEINPGPTLKKLTRVPDSQKERSWIYDLSSVVLKTIHGHDLEVKTDGLWKEPPKNWDTRQPFYDPRNKPKGYNLTSKDDILLLDNLIHSCEQTEKQIPHLFHGEVTLWRNGNKQELFQHYLLRTEKNVITEATKVLCLYSDDNSLKDQLQERKIGLIRNQTGTNKTIKKPKNYLDVVRDIATTLCRLSKRLPITEKSDGIWKTPPLGWNPKDEYYSPCNAGKRTETHQDKQLVDNLINCCERQKTEIPSELQPIVKAWKGGNREEVTKEYTIWANVCLIHHSLEYLKVEGLLGKPQVQQLLQELGISRSTDTTTENQSTQNNKPTLKKRKRKATLAVDEATKMKSAISNTVTALPACDEDHETSCDPTTTVSSDKSNDDEVAHGLPANTTECSGTTKDSSSISVVDTSTESSDVAMGSGLATMKTNALVAVATSLQDVDTSNLSTDGEDPEEIEMEIEKHNLSRDFELDPDIDKYLTQENSENIQFDPLLFDNLVNSVNAN